MYLIVGSSDGCVRLAGTQILPYLGYDHPICGDLSAAGERGCMLSRASAHDPQMADTEVSVGFVVDWCMLLADAISPGGNGLVYSHVQTSGILPSDLTS